MLPLNRSAIETPEPLAETGFLVQAVVQADARSGACAKAVYAAQGSVATPAPAWWNLQDRALWLVDLFERLERQDRAR